MNVAECCGSFLQSQITEFLSESAISEGILQAKMLGAFLFIQMMRAFYFDGGRRIFVTQDFLEQNSKILSKMKRQMDNPLEDKLHVVNSQVSDLSIQIIVPCDGS